MITMGGWQASAASPRARAIQYMEQLQQLEEEGVLEFDGYYPLKPDSKRDYGFKIRFRGQSQWHLVPARAIVWVILGVRAGLSVSVPVDEL